MKDEVTVADVAVWSILFPLATGAKHQQKLLSEQSHVQRWYSHLSVQPQVKVHLGTALQLLLAVHFDLLILRSSIKICPQVLSLF